MIRIYGVREHLNPVKQQLSDAINECMAEALSFPSDKRCQRFFPMEKEDCFYPVGRSDRYTVIEISMMEGRSPEARKRLIHLLFEKIEAKAGITSADVEITIFESPACNWGFRGMTGDEAKLSYKVNV